MLEKDFQGSFGRWLKGSFLEAASAKAAGASAPIEAGFFSDATSGSVSAAFELKLAKEGRSIGFRQIEEHQVEGLRRVEGLEDGKILFLKLSDLSLGRKPFDCFKLCGRGYFVFGWHGLRGKGGKAGTVGASGAGGKALDTDGKASVRAAARGGVAVVAVRVGAFLAMRARLEGEGRKSFKMAEAVEAGEFVGILKGSGELVRA
jgi:hypothetical protein